MYTTVFTAVQCFQCSTMQVKQQKKSSNKWNCVVCNEKQSVRKVFAQGFMAKDLRKFVQTFNMSRSQFEQQQRTNETLDLVPDHTANQPQNSNGRKRRFDWSEYIDPQDNRVALEEDEQEDVFGPRIVTELPSKAVFRKPKLNADSSGFGTTQDGEKGFRPVFQKRNSNKGKEPRKLDPKTANWASERFACKSQSEEVMVVLLNRTASAFEGRRQSSFKGDSNQRTYAKQQGEDGFAQLRALHPTTTNWGEYIIQDTNEDFEDKEPQKCQLRMMKGASKWDNYNTDDDDDDAEGDLCLKIGREFADHKVKLDDCVFDTKLYDESVEEDIHPDFL